jgi:hypothetical protein
MVLIRILFLLNIFCLSIVILSCQKAETNDKYQNIESDEKDSLGLNIDTLKFIAGLFSTINPKWYEGSIESGIEAVLLFRSDLVDTVEFSSGLFAINDSTVFYKRFQNASGEDFPSRPEIVTGYASEYYLWSKGNKVRVITILPLFNDIVSSPAFIDSCILYWGLKQMHNYYKIYAMRYHTVSGIVDSLYLTDDEVATDFSGYFVNPFKDSIGYTFSNGSVNWLVDRQFKICKQRLE